MSGVLVDTSVWIDHFRHTNAALETLLSQDLVLTHPMVIGEIACGTPPVPLAEPLASVLEPVLPLADHIHGLVNED